MNPTQSYLIMATPRSGSYLLCEALTATGLAGMPTEHFQPEVVSVVSRRGPVQMATWLEATKQQATTPNGVFGSKIIWQFLEYFIQGVRVVPGFELMPVPELLATLYPNLSYIWIRRRDKVRQAISYSKALQTGMYVEVFERKPSDDRQPQFDFRLIDFLYRSLLADEREMERYFAQCGVDPCIVTYEDFATTYEQTALRVLEYLHIPIPAPVMFGERHLRKQANAESEQWVERYLECKREHEERYGPYQYWPRYNTWEVFNRASMDVRNMFAHFTQQ